ncbi:SUKH-3 domain-containing protein [Ruminiclostridium cellobioparum]|uniref:SUKH-3 domain-containing protein n=1 Tax=Ruminiclostridium cellobioparum TaxID=29355 RepID=UPI001A9A5FD5|nr:SUKH-3 domain-containing protein [Ruminiclostridium cellobioparum]
MTQQDINILQKTIGNQAVIKLLTDIKKIPPKNNQPGQDKETTPGTQDKQPDSKMQQSEKQQSEKRQSGLQQQDTGSKTVEKSGEQSDSGDLNSKSSEASGPAEQKVEKQEAKEKAAPVTAEKSNAGTVLSKSDAGSNTGKQVSLKESEQAKESSLQQNKEPLQTKLENGGNTDLQTGKESKPASLKEEKAAEGGKPVENKNVVKTAGNGAETAANKDAQAKQEAVSPVEDVPTPAGSEKAGGKETGQAQGDSKGGSKSEGGGDFFGTVRSGIHNNLMTLGLINLKKLGMQILAAGAAKISGAIRKMLTSKVKFKLGSENHEMWVEKGQNRNVVMMASGKGEPFGDQLKRRNIPNDVEVIRDQKEAEAPENEKIAEPKVRNLAETTETVASGTGLITTSGGNKKNRSPGGDRLKDGENPKGENDVKNRTKASVYADEVRDLPSSKRPNTVAVIEIRGGQIIYGYNSEGVYNKSIQDILNALGNISFLETYVFELLKHCGWYDGRKFDISFWINELTKEGYECFKYAEDILQELGDIKVNVGNNKGYKGAMFDFNPYNAASGEYDRIEAFQVAAGDKLFPIGSMCDAIVYVGQKKNIYFGDWSTFFWHGKNLEDYLNRLFREDSKPIQLI